MSKGKRVVYGPNQRGYFEKMPSKIKSYSKVDYTFLPTPENDPIVSNNISNMEFDYTYNGGEDIYVEDYLDE